MATEVLAYKPRSLPPLTSGSDPEPISSLKSGKRKKKKKPLTNGIDNSDSPATTSTSRPHAEDGETEDRLHSLSGSSENILSETPKKRKRKATSAKLRHGYEFESGAEVDLRGDENHINNLKSSPGAARRRRTKDTPSKPRIPRSVSEEILQQEQNGHLESQRDTPRKKKAKPKADDSPDADGEGETGRTPRSKPPSGRKPKKRRQQRAISADEDYQADGEVSVDFMVHEDDLVVADKDRTLDPQMPSHTTVLPSQPTGRLFLERKSGFKSEHKSRLAQVKETDEDKHEIVTTLTSPELALSVHRATMTISLFCHGLLAGFALWQCIVVYSLSEGEESIDREGDINFLQNYYKLSVPAMCMYYFLLAVCAVSAFDRYDLARPNRKFFKGLITFQSGAISILVYLITLIFSVSTAALDDRIGLYGTTDPPLCDSECLEEPLWPEGEDSKYRLYVWRILNLMRVIGSVIGWIIISLTSTTDYTQDHLKKSDEPLWDSQGEAEMNERQHGV
ncbi:transmembrane protein 237B-like [Saccoglossus kowalevskii]|uniref:Transmembrane protein 237A-like n=1 Tax=Saccoglossus kowalevskii TaxID=10224 RepID=A0ABM0MKL0_SACKO|nr:PREDICTED: transmembrane protein 237A-like [Saccoglossus kowalevskii]